MPGFWTKTKGGHTIHVNGDPNMSEKTLAAICDLADAAARQENQLLKDFEQLWDSNDDENKKACYKWFRDGYHLAVQRMNNDKTT